MSSINNQAATTSPEDAEYLLAGTGTEFMAALKGQVFFAPLDTAREEMKILDMACADGVYLTFFIPPFSLRTLLREMSTRLPSSTSFVGVDLMKSFLPAKDATPDNYRYLAQDVLTPLPGDLQGVFDLANVRLMFAGVVGKEAAAVQNLVDGLKSGGWLQIMEMRLYTPYGGDDDKTAYDDADDGDGETQSLKDFKTLLSSVFAAIGLQKGFPMGLEGVMKDAGLQDVRVVVVDAPIGKDVSEDRKLQLLSVGPFQLTIKTLVATCEKLGLQIPASVTDNLEDRLVRDALEHGGKFQFAVLTGRKA
ncbi:uncharacterized protein B0I36DRAFT_381297 [Microdochium trichocladiopsis]|uniref:Uncharacterized protein n=1 Tax=Microdochium trichocladiopsis TaxID=1682393 RepID=A0A9P9BV38_9PEZI|nr:uncharacterized protein B0I36DRAFT_381297 [Microdochium trichocladiopsis]KAH7038246.1 hypothetical protein B0I36DRAFT_381297 [Microdochium trichocladiopsis]